MNEEEKLRRILEHDQTPIDDVIAEEFLIGMLGSERKEIVLQIGRPFYDEDGMGRCPVAIWGLNGRYPDIHGEGTIQALYLACELVSEVILQSCEQGLIHYFIPGDEDEPDEELTLDNLRSIFGRLKGHK